MLVDAQKAEEGSQTILYPRSFYLSLPKAVLKDKTTISTEAHTTNSAVTPRYDQYLTHAQLAITRSW